MVGKSLKKWWPVFVLPTLAAFIIGFLWPFIWGIYLSFCKFTTVKDVVWVGLDNYKKIHDRRRLQSCILVDRCIRICVQYSDQCAGICHCTGSYKGLQRNKRVPYCIFYAEPDWWYRTWLYLADFVKRTAFHVGTASFETVRNKRFYWYDHSSFVAADRIYDDYLCSRT